MVFGRFTGICSRLVRFGGRAGFAACLCLGIGACLAFVIATSGCSSSPVSVAVGASRVAVVQTAEGFGLDVDGERFFIRGAGGQSRLGLLAASGANSIRTWGADGLGDVLDRAHANGLKVTAGIWLRHPRHGFDYSDAEAVRAQLEMVERVVLRHRDHPALLMWGVGNEVELMWDADEVFPHVNDAAALIKRLDPDHPTMVVIAGAAQEKIEAYLRHCTDADVLGVNSYGEIGSVAEDLLRFGYSGPYVVTEFGPRGHWETAAADWGAPIEASSAEKAEMYQRAYESAVLGAPTRCLGSYAFLWGDKQETTATWFGLLLPTGERTQACDVLQELWTGVEPESRSPVVRGIESELALARVPAGGVFAAKVLATDPDRDDLACDWAVVEETRDRRFGGDREERPPEVPGSIMSTDGLAATVRVPEAGGAYRLFVTVRDGRGNAGTANVPFFVE